MGLSEARKRANIKYLKNNPDKRRLYQYRSNARLFVKRYASVEDLNSLQQLIDKRREELSNH